MTLRSIATTRILCLNLCLGLFLGGPPALAHHDHNDHHHHDDYYYGGGAFLGGMLTNQILTNMELQSDAERRPPPVQYGDYADHRSMIERQDQPYQRTATSRMAELDQLAASGSITPKEYKDKRLAIVDGL